MEISRVCKECFAVIGKEGSTVMGEGFVQKLWNDANSHFNEVAGLAKKDENGKLVGVWGAMTDFSRSFLPWQDGFSKGLYLAGVECPDDAEAPDGWTKWTVPGYEYFKVLCDSSDIFARMIDYMAEENIALAGAVHDFTDPESGQNYMFFPIRRI